MIDNLILKVVEFFNELPLEERTIISGDLYFITMHYMVNDGDGEIRVGDHRDWPDATYMGTGRYLWVGETGADLRATEADFMPISMETVPSFPFELINITDDYPASDTMIDAEWVAEQLGNSTTPIDYANKLNVFGMGGQDNQQQLWVTNPFFVTYTMGDYNVPDILMRIRPLYSKERLVFNFPSVINEAVTLQNGGGNMVFSPIVSMKPVCFDEETEVHVMFNPHYADSVTENTTNPGTIRLHLIWQSSPDSAPPNTSPSDLTGEGDRLILTLEIQSFNPISTYVMIQPTDGRDGAKTGLTGCYYWLWEDSELPKIGDMVIRDLSITVTTKVRNQFSDLVGTIYPF